MHYEQAVYGSFPFWDRGYAVLAHSPGCLPVWLDEFQAACQKFGESSRSASDGFPGAMFSVRLSCERRPWLIVGVSTPGTDDRGRPDALAFHGLFIEDRAFRKAGFNPFALAGCLRRDWNAETRLLPGVWDLPLIGAARDGWGPGTPRSQPPHVEAAAIAMTLSSGKRVALQSDTPIDALARAVWAALPQRVRRRSSVATFAFANALRFDLLASPRLDTLNLDASYVSPSSENRRDRTPMRWRPYAISGAIAILLLVALSFVYRVWTLPREPSAFASVPRPEPRVLSVAAHPDPSSYRQIAEDPDESRAVERGLAALGARFLRLKSEDAQGPTAWMMAIAALRYHGPLLSAEDVAKIKSDASPGSARALSCDAHIRKVAPDRPLPEGFASGPLRWQLDTLAWSFHLDLDPKLTPAEIPLAIAEALAREEPVEPNPLEAEYPALEDYSRFLETLPGRE